MTIITLLGAALSGARLGGAILTIGMYALYQRYLASVDPPLRSAIKTHALVD